MADDSPRPADTASTDGSSSAADDPVIALLREARLVFGAVLVDDEPRLVECLDRDRFAEDGAEMALAMAVTSANADLVPFVTERRDEMEGETENAAGDETENETTAPPQIDSFDEVVSAVEGSHTFYLVLNTAPGEWNRVRHADAGETPRYRVADAVVTEATERIGDFPDGVDGTDIEIIDWSG